MNRKAVTIFRTAAGHTVKGLALSLILLSASACSNNAKPTEKAESGDPSLPVISGTPVHDAEVLREADRKLDYAEYDKLEKKGPQPVWGNSASTQPSITANSEKGQFQIGSGDRDTTPASTQPSQMLSGINEAELPVKIVELPDGKLRIVWVLRSYGGANVTSSRDAATNRRTVTAAAPDLTPLVTVVQQQLGATGTVTPIASSNTLIVTCDKAAKLSILDLLARLDATPRQVEITAKVFEVSHDFDFQQGARLLAKHIGANNAQTGASTFDAQNFLNSITNPTAGPAQGSVISLMNESAKNGLSIEASFQLLANAGLITVVSSPRMTVAVGQTGYLLAGQELPIQTANIINNNLQTSTTYKPVGVQLYITPEAVSRRKIKLHTITIVSSVSGFTPMASIDGNAPIQNIINPVIDAREAETLVTVEDGHTMVISGLRMNKTMTREDKVPGLGDIPLLGWLFKSQRTQQQMTDLYFFVTPTMLVDPSAYTEPAAPTAVLPAPVLAAPVAVPLAAAAPTPAPAPTSPVAPPPAARIATPVVPAPAPAPAPAVAAAPIPAHPAVPTPAAPSVAPAVVASAAPVTPSPVPAAPAPAPAATPAVAATPPAAPAATPAPVPTAKAPTTAPTI